MEIWCGPIMVLEQIANLSLGVIRVLGSSPSRTAKFICTDGREAQCIGLQIRKTVGSNPTLCSKF
jgi:hypothetical protein